MIVTLARQLRQVGVLGMNRRNRDYVLAYNPRRLYPLADDKLRIKQLAQQAGIAVPELYGVVEIEGRVRTIPVMLGNHDSFVVKPASGSSGKGIVVISQRHKSTYRKSSGVLMSEGELRHHVTNILSGMFSLGGQQDKALFEYLVQFDPVFDRVSYLGVPDIRIIVYRGVPVMCMVRLPTRMSDGRANLHQGAVGAGIDMATGYTCSAVWRNQNVTEHPDTGYEVTGIQVPFWDRLLDMATRSSDLTGLGYLGVDLVLDRDKGPMLLELNARPGLTIQIANQAGLLSRLQQVDREVGDLPDRFTRIAFAKQQFSTALVRGVATGR
jgi:alpha-L-glutamate ligase-like protein